MLGCVAFNAIIENRNKIIKVVTPEKMEQSQKFGLEQRDTFLRQMKQ